MAGENGAHRARVVVGVDGSSYSDRALRWAAFLADTLGGGVDVVTAWQNPTAYGVAVLPDNWDPARDMQGVARASIHRCLGETPPVPVRIRVGEGSAAHVLLEAAKGADLLVVGSRGHGGFVGLLLGSVSAGVAEHAPCPVFIVHGDKEPPPVPSG